jgi:isopenicillin N synthase-like dioxygenase
MKRTRGDAFSPQESNPEVASFQARELEISVLRRRVQEADERAAKLEARCKQLEFESQESKMKHVASLKELDSYVCAHNMEKYQGKAREMEWKNKFSILHAEHYRLKSDFANLEVAVEMKVQHEVSSWRSRVAQLENELRDVSRELKQIRK